MGATETPTQTEIPREHSERPAKLTRWRPKRWLPWYEQVVALAALGKPQKELAELFNVTPQHINNIVNCPEASLTRGQLMEKLNQAAVNKLEQDFETLAVQAKRRVAQVLYDEELFKASPFQVVDRGIAVLRGIGKLKTEGSGVNIGKALIMSTDDVKLIREAIVKSDVAHALHPVEVESKEIKE